MKRRRVGEADEVGRDVTVGGLLGAIETVGLDDIDGVPDGVSIGCRRIK